LSATVSNSCPQCSHFIAIHNGFGGSFFNGILQS
jgi:hypothetical protein